MTLRGTNVFCVLILLLAFGCEEPERWNLIYSDFEPVTASTVRIHSRVIATTDDLQIVLHGICWSTSPSPDPSENKIIVTGMPPEGNFTLNLPNLDRRKQYHVRAFLTNIQGEIFYGNELVFINDFLPELVSTRISGYREDGFQITTSVNYTGIAPITEVGHAWGRKPMPTIDGQKSIAEGLPTSEGDFHSEIQGLKKDSLYYFRAYAISEGAVTYGKQLIGVVPNEIINGRWEYISMPDLSIYFTNTLAIKDEIYFFGGFNRYVLDENSEPASMKKIYHLPYNRLSDIGAVPEPVGDTPFSEASFAFATGSSAYFYTTGWPSMHEYQTTTGQWATRPKLGGNVQFMVSDGVDGYAAIIRNGTIGTFYRYSTETNKWTVIKSYTFADETLGTPLIIDGVLYFLSGENRFYALNLSTNAISRLDDFPGQPSLLFDYNKTVYVITGNEVFHFRQESGWKKNSRAPIEPLRREGDYEMDGVVPSYLRLNGETYISVFYPEYLWETEYEFSNLMLKYSE